MKFRRLGFVLAALAAATAGCASTATTAGEGITVAASFYPVAEVARHVGGDRIDVTDLTPAGAEPHDVELTARDLALIEQADLVVYLGGGFQPAVERAVAQRRGPVLDVLRGLDLRPDDPHVWLDPLNMKQIAAAIAAALTRADAAGGAAYAANSSAYSATLDSLHADFAKGLATCERRLLVTAHAAFGYLAGRYDLQFEAIAGIAPDAEPTAGRLDELRSLVRDRGVTTIFTETLVSPRVAQTLAREAGVDAAVLDPIEGLAADDARAGATYETVMRDNLAGLRKALGCR